MGGVAGGVPKWRLKYTYLVSAVPENKIMSGSTLF